MGKRIVVLGSAGQLGIELCAELSRRGYAVSGLERASLDICIREQVESVLTELEPWAVFNAAAFNQVDISEREPATAFESNALGVCNTALVCRKIKARLIHFSTDYVFDGKLGRPYLETDPTHPIGSYAVSKLAGELYAQAYLDRAIVIRTSGVFGVGGRRTARGNFPELMLRMAREGKPLRVVNDHVASPTYAPALASRSIDILEKDLDGLFHVGGGEPISWYAWAKLIFEKAGVKANLTATNDQEYHTAAARPKFSALDNARLREHQIAPMPPLATAIEDYLAHRR